MRELIVPELSWPLSLSPQQLSLDVVEVTVKGIRIEGDAARSWQALEALPNLRVFTKESAAVQLFNRPHRRYALSPLIAKIRSAGTQIGGTSVSPVFAGRLVARNGRLPTHLYAGSQKCVNISLDLKLNVPRFITAQDICSPSIRGTGDKRYIRRIRAARPFTLASPQNILVECDEVAFGRDGNVLMGSDLLYRYAYSKSSVQHCIELINTILDNIVSWLRNQLDTRSNRVLCSTSFSLGQVEWHAEFRVFDPRRQIRHLTPMLLRQGRSANIFRRRLTGQVRMFGPHSHAVQIALAEGIKQVTYAKTSRRIRFGMKYKRACFPRLIGKRAGLGSDQLANALQTLQRHASRELQNVFDALNPRMEPLQAAPRRDDLVGCIAYFSENLHFSEEITRSLRDTGRVVVENGSALRPSIDVLRQVGVLKFTRHSVYTVTDEFEAALYELMAQPIAVMDQ